MAPEKSPAFQFYPKEFLTDGNVAGMSLQERGAYITLICICWQEQSLPIDPTRLANIVGLPFAAFKKVWPAIAVCFTERDGRLIHQRLEKERVKQATNRQRQSDKGKASAIARAVSQPDTQPESNRGSTAVQPEVNQSSTGRPPDGQPKVNSPVSGFLSSEKARARAGGAEPIIGRNPHLDHAACGPDLLWCVPSSVHRKFVEALAPKFAGDRDKARDALQAWYLTVWPKLPAEFVIGDAFKFWQPRFDAELASADSVASKKPVEPRTIVPGAEATRKYLEGLQ